MPHLSRQSPLVTMQRSVIVKNVEENALAVARGKQRNIADWPRPTKK